MFWHRIQNCEKAMNIRENLVSPRVVSGGQDIWFAEHNATKVRGQKDMRRVAFHSLSTGGACTVSSLTSPATQSISSMQSAVFILDNVNSKVLRVNHDMVRVVENVYM